MRKAILSLGQGDLDKGFVSVTIQLCTFQGQTLMKSKGSLPPRPSLAVLHSNWQSLYRGYYQNIGFRLDLDIIDGHKTVRYSEAEFHQACEQLPQQLNDWLNSDSFSNIDRQLRRHLHDSAQIQLIVETEDKQVLQLPWHLWNFLQDYPKAEVAYCLPEFEGGFISSQTPPGEVKILGILGNSTNINLTDDRILIEQIPGARPTFLQEPELHELNAQLWEEDWTFSFLPDTVVKQAKYISIVPNKIIV